METEKKINCLLGNGICPKYCPNHEIAAEVTKEFGDQFDPFFARMAVVFGDCFYKGVNVSDIVRAMNKCSLEPKENIRRDSEELS